MKGRIFTASQVANGKPAPDLFPYGAAHIGPSPAHALLIKDSLTGLQAARAGWLSYVGGLPQDQIATELNISRQQPQQSWNPA